MSYLFGFLSFAAAIAAIFGDTWDSKKPGWRRLTPAGWVIVAASTISLCGTIWNQWTTTSESNRIQKQSLVAIQPELEDIMWILQRLVADATKGLRGIELKPDSIDITNIDNVKILEIFNLLSSGSSTYTRQHESWVARLGSTFSQTRRNIGNVFIYAGVHFDESARDCILSILHDDAMIRISNFANRHEPNISYMSIDSKHVVVLSKKIANLLLYIENNNVVSCNNITINK